MGSKLSTFAGEASGKLRAFDEEENDKATLSVDSTFRQSCERSQEVELKLSRMKKSLETIGYICIPGHWYRSFLVYFGASYQDLSRATRGEFHDLVERDIEDAMSFRQIAFHRMVWNQAQKDLVGPNSSVSSIQPTNRPAITHISKDEICSDAGANIFFERSSKRTWNLPPLSFADSSLPQAIARMNAFFEPASHHPQANLSQDHEMSINDQILIRVNKYGKTHPLAACGGVHPEPTPEGIHQDGSEISSVTLLRRFNTPGCDSRLWKLKQPAGNYRSSAFGSLDGEPQEGFSWDHCLLNKTLKDPWETIIFNDRKVKHEAREFFATIDDEEHNCCCRDVIVNFLRKPLLDGSDDLIDEKHRSDIAVSVVVG